MQSGERLVLGAQEDPWLGGQIGRLALRLSVEPAGDDGPLRSRLASEAVFATAKVPAADIRSLHFLEDIGCRVVDLSLTLALEPADLQVGRPSGVRPARTEDQAAVEAIAGSAFRFSRFHLDEAIPQALAHRIKRAWATNYFSGGRGTALLLAEDADGVCGFLQVLESGDAAVIDLIAVAPRAAGQGRGSALVAALAAAPLSSGDLPRRILVGSQAANLPAVRFYEKLGFRLEAATYVLHHHGCSTDYRVE